MNAAATGKTLKRKVTEPLTNWKQLRSLTDKQIRAGLRKDPDVHPTDEVFWAKAKLVMPRSKKTVTMRLDADLLDWFRRNPGYQTRINAILRAYMDAQVHYR
ncbi:MAG: BrnA antitoxin family protein [Terriglobales bacterium]